MSIDDLLARMRSEQNRRQVTVKDVIFAIGLIALVLEPLYNTIYIQSEVRLSNFARILIFQNILCIAGNIFLLVAIFMSRASQLDILYKIIKIICYVLIVEAIINIMQYVGWEDYGFYFYEKLFAIPFYVLILYFYRKGH